MTDVEKNIIFSVDKENEEKIVVNKSIFIGIIRKVENREEILKFKEEVMKRYPNATHYVLAYKIWEEEFFDDDGEPSKTSGLPILKCILGNNLNNTCIIVVRYFGGILLGTGGLVKAYTESAKTVISTSNIVRYIRVKKVKLVYRYDDISKIKRIIEEIGRIKIGEETFVDIISEKYTEKVELEIYISYNICDILKKKIEVDNIINVNKSESETKSEIIFKEQEGYMYVKLK